MKVWAYDIETLINCFTVTFVDVNNLENHRSFVISHLWDTSYELQIFMLSEVDGLISFNGVNFDRPILGEVLANTMPHIDADTIAKHAYESAQAIIELGIRPAAKDFSIKRSSIPELDLYLLYHFNNESRRTSLKWIQCHLNMDNIQEMPHPHSKPVTTIEQINDILDYNLNDCIATAKLYLHPRTRDLVDLRKWAKKQYGVPTLNISNAHMGEMIFLKNIGDIPSPDIKARKIRVKDLILPQIKFKSKQFNKILDHFKKVEFSTSDEKPKVGRSIIFNGMKYVFGLGGLHAVCENMCYDQTVDSVDGKSYYPNLAISFKFKPKHIGDRFTDVYGKLYVDRVYSATAVANNGLKEALNSVFGKGNSIYSPLYDPDFTFSITVNGQLFMAMWAERIELLGAGTVVMVNTDGMEVLVKNRAKFDQINDAFMKLTGIPVSTSQYQRLMIRDVNNYIGMTYKGDTKVKGCYEIEKDWHKDPSAKICALAVREWFVNQIPVEVTIKKWRGIHEQFYLYRRAKTGKFMAVSLNGQFVIEVPKTIRYLATKIGFVLFQETDAKKSKVHSDAYVTICNDLNIQEEVDIDLDWYIREARKMIIETKEPRLFE